LPLLRIEKLYILRFTNVDTQKLSLGSSRLTLSPT
jgi:hypothetical protein